MNFLLKSGLMIVGSASVVLSLSTTVARGLLAPSCTDIVIPVTVSAQNLAIPVTNPPTYVTVQGTYNIAARYCEPLFRYTPHINTLQLLVHGGSYTRNYWSGDGAPGQGYHGDQYSWIAFASFLGYPTLSIDRICNGLSDHADPLAICQTNLGVETIHQIIVKARNNQLPGPANRAFSRIVYVGHSLGSITANVLHAKYPNDADASILTGWSSTVDLSILNTVFFPGSAPAALLDPVKWGSLDLNYLAFNSTSAFQTLFYHIGAYDPALFNLDYAASGTLALGEGLSLNVEYATLAPKYINPLLVLTGQNDQIFCPATQNSATDCGFGWSSALGASQSLYPASKRFDTYAIPGAGHCWNFHYQAIEGFLVAHNWLLEQGF